MSGFTISSKDRKILIELHRAQDNKKEADKIKVILLLADGYTFLQIEKILLIDIRTLKRYKKIFGIKGIEGLISNNHRGGFFKLSDDEIIDLKKVLDTHLFSSAAQVCEYVRKHFKEYYTPDGMVQTLKRLGYSYKKTKAVSGKADPEKQKEYVKNYQKLRKNLKKKEKIYFIDATHPTHNMMPDYAWIRKGEERTVSCNDGRKRLNLIGAYSPTDHEIVVKEAASANSASTIELLNKIETIHPELEQIYIILDNAPYNYSKLIREFEEGSKFKFVYLPSYSPNLNLIERLWKFFKKSVIRNKYYEHFDEFRKTCLNFFKNKNKDFKTKLNSLLTENFHIFSSA